MICMPKQIGKVYRFIQRMCKCKKRKIYWQMASGMCTCVIKDIQDNDNGGI